MDTFAALLQPFLQWLWQATLVASLVTCLILVAQRSLGHKLGPRWSHALWLVLLIRMVVPWAPPSRISLLNLLPPSVRQAQAPPIADFMEQERNAHSAAISEAVRVPTEQQATSSQPAPEAASPGPRTSARAQRPSGPAFLTLHRVVPMLWLAGAALVGAYLLAGHFALWRIVKRERPLVQQSTLELFEQCKARMGVQTLVAVVPSDQVVRPALFGFVRPRLLLPRQMLDTAGRNEMRYVFLHELAHLKRHDIYLAWVASLLQVLHWFNPLVWFAFHRMRTDRELACDALVLASIGEQESQEYGRAIVALLQRLSRSRPLPAMAGILESKSQLKRRIAMIARFKNNSYRWSPLAVTLVAVLCGVSLPDAGSGKAAQPRSVSMAADRPTPPVPGDSSVFVDPNTGITFRKARTLSGPSDIIESTDNLQMSPNGRFLLSGVKVVPLDGSQPFTLMEGPRAVRGVWSPDGKKVLLAAGALWVVTVNPETGRPTAQAEKLYERGGVTADWLGDSEKVTFMRFAGGEPSRWTLSVSDKSLEKAPDLWSYREKRSPDGEKVAFSTEDLWVKSAEGTEAKMVADVGTPILWSADSEWLLYTDGHGSPTGHVEEPRFFRFADSRQQKLKLPGVGTVVGTSADHKKLFYYCASYERGPALQVASVSGGPTCQLGGQLSRLMPYDQFWSPDSSSIVVPNDVEGDGGGLVALPLSGAAPVAFRMDVGVPGKISYWQLSPYCDHMLFCVSSDDKTFDIWGAPVSWKQRQSTRPATLIFKNWSCIPWGGSCTPGVWSPDGKTIAILQKGEIWLTTPEGGEPARLKVPEVRGRQLFWSPDSSMIAFYTPVSALREALQIVSASGGEAKTIAELRAGSFLGSAAWSPDSKAMTIAKRDGQILSVSIADGQGRQLVNLNDLDMGSATGLHWSPDGKALAFKSHKPGESYQNQLFLFDNQDGHITKVADEIVYYFWSPDSQWISCMGFRFVKTRPAGILWEMDIEEALARLAK
jgi:beta-lactamase regulating signal transducer with metallopeptidase domain/Tol biopolymer transport system component